MRKFDIKNIKNITELESYVIGQALDFYYKMETIKENLLININDYTKVQALGEQAKIHQTLNNLFDFNKQVFERLSPETLNKIINEDKFEARHQWSNDESKVIPKSILPKFSSYDKFANDHPKAAIAKRLGATITA